MLDLVRNHCLSKFACTEDFPFDQSTLVFKVGGKMFALIDVDTPDYINLKCNPEYSAELQADYASITPGFHMNKKHWISVGLHGELDHSMLLKLIDDSYQLVYQSLTKKVILELRAHF